MKKFTKIIAAATAALLVLGFAGCDKNTESGSRTPISYPTFINSTQQGGGEEEASEKYVVNVLSEGGMKLDGVQVALKRGNTELRRGISKNGKIEFPVTLGDYELVVDGETLPAGYYLNGDTTYHTNPDKREEVNIKIPSRLLSAAASVASYAPGNIMRDFTFTDVDGGQHTLSTLLSTRKAVVLNFFFTTCSPCNAEFPYLQASYASRTSNDIQVLGICTTNMGDTNESVANKKLEHGLTFPVGIDKLGLCSAFGVSNYPTTIVIDRYGMIAFRESGGQPSTSYWTQLFNKFVSPNYVQEVKREDGTEDPGNNVGTELKKPTVTMPASRELEQAALDNTKATFRAEDDEYSWPWLAGKEGDDTYIYSSNTKEDNSYSIVHVDIPMKEGDVLSFEYKISSEASADFLYVIMDGAQMNTGYSGGDGQWHTVNLYVSDRDKTVDLAFVYRKDAGDPETGTGDDVAKIRRINVSDKSTIENEAPLDVMRTCASGGINVEENKYNNYVEAVFNEEDHFYHKGSADGPIIYMTISQLTPWSELHTGKTSTAADGTTYTNTIFKITEQNYITRVTNPDDDSVKIIVNIGGVDVTDAYTEYVLIMSYMPAPFYLIPVTPELKGWAEALIADYEKGTQHEDEWQEFCYYYDHYGVEHDDATHGDDETCKVDNDYTYGLTRYNAYTAYEQGDPRLEDETSATYSKYLRNRALINFPLQLVHNGTYYKFTASKAGVYQIRSYTTDCSPSNKTSETAGGLVAPDPAISIYDKDGNYLSFTNGVFDHDAYKDVDYEGFNTYVTLDAGEEIFLYLETTSATRSYYDFEITYHEQPYQKMMVCSTGGGAWTWKELEDGTPMFVYLGIDVMYDDISGTYCAVKDGKPDPEQPVYIDMIYSSFLISDLTDYNYSTLQYMIQCNLFNDHMYMGGKYQAIMNRLLGEALDKPESSETYGLVPATEEIVNVLNQFIDENGGKGEGNGWLAWAVYNAKIG